MRRMITVAAMLALALPTLATAEEQHHPGTGKPGAPAGGGKPAMRQVTPHPGPMGGPHAAPVGGMHPGPVGGVHPGPVGAHAGGPVGHEFSYRGHMVHRVHLAPFVYPNGWAYRRWDAGMILPPLFLGSAYFYADWAGLGLAPPEPGFQWVRYGPDLLLVNVSTGQVVDTAYGVVE